ncbi:hydrolase 1, exosortase A system-associated [Rhizorhapis suberifaciens]|uniref:Exosortase A-associated hydrolase 1 n=1 Tax=Rhizorhapis suberifaciens TaxID=13656 RepID=A0A840HUZ0_9SPHN|nr:hydrolase 1, exosortase A system-associated [Rhizorhapis suberifaciens]MBB4642102.1 exosortase A-associated hydrolase 1 [Rhizorhapis suberifaciens]
MRQHLQFSCRGCQLAGTVDEGRSTTGLLIVSGGNELRAGAHRGMAKLAARLARDGFSVFRFDRRGVGDSEGDNAGFMSSAPDIAAALKAFRNVCPQLERIVTFGNCDAATALALHHDPDDVAALLLANPWVIENEDGMPTAAAIRRRYWERLRNPRKLWELATGRVNYGKLLQGMKAASSHGEESRLGRDLASALCNSRLPVTFLLAERDNSSIAFQDMWQRPSFRPLHGGGRVRTIKIPTSSHSFAKSEDAEALYRAVRNMLHHISMG